MSSGAYEILALFMRYVFVLIGGLIVWRSFRWLLKDHRAYRREMKALPDAGLVGEMVNLRTGKAFPLPREGNIGSSRECDIRVKGSGVAHTHARFEFVDGLGLRVIPFRGCAVTMGDKAVRGQGYALHGTQLRLGDGDTVLRVRLFAGLKVPRPTPYQQESGDEDEILDATPENLATPALGFPSLDAIAYQGQDPDASVEEAAPPLPQSPDAYDGNYTDDGEMTWQYAYSLEELRQAMEEQQRNQAPSAGETLEEDGEGIPYQSPLQNRRRRRDRHG